MKFIPIFILVLLLAACASTTVKESGQTVLHTQADSQTLSFKTAHSSLVMTGVSHSAPTLAGGQAFKMGADSIGTTVVSSLLTGGLPWQAGVAAGAAVLPQILRPAVPAVLQSKH